MTAIVELTNEQIVSLYAQLEPQVQRRVLYTLAESGKAKRQERVDLGETALRRRAVERGLNWDAMDEDERLFFVDDLVHEDR
jgi:hypothetical protein